MKITIYFIVLFIIGVLVSQVVGYSHETNFGLKHSPYRKKWTPYRKVTARVKYKNFRTRAPDNETVSVETAAKRAILRQQRVKKNKFAMLLAYSGQQYFGFQRNPSVKTVEEDLLLALLQVGYINEEMFNETRLIHFVKASRTDKGVSALGQVVSLKLPINATRDVINAHLPPEIQVIALVKVTQGFNSRKVSNGRTYSYTLPTFAFAPNATEEFRLTDLIRQQINTILALFCGSHSFHNFTSGRIPMDSDSFRTIISFICCEPFIAEGIEFVSLRIKGKSFMIHQIRRMVGLVISIMRGITREETIKQALGRQVFSIPLAPSVGLLLEQVHYDHYNNKYGSDGIHSCLDWSKWESEINLFKEKFISPTIYEAEKKDKSRAVTSQLGPLKMARHSKAEIFGNNKEEFNFDTV